jgi:hypothetical protein
MVDDARRQGRDFDLRATNIQINAEFLDQPGDRRVEMFFADTS